MSDSNNDIVDSINEIINSQSSEVSEAPKIKVKSSSKKSSNMLDNVKNLLNKKNIYILCGVIIIGIIAYYFLYKKKDKETKKSDVVISLPNSDSVENPYNLPMPSDPSQPLQMTQDDYANLMQQQQMAQQQTNQMPQIIHPNQDIIDDNDTQSQEPLTAKEIQNISQQLQQMQKEKA